MSPYASYLLETFATLLAVCGVAFVMLLGARKMGVGRAPTGGVELLGRLPLDARRSVVLVKVGATVFVIGVGDGGMTKLGELPAADVPREAAQPSSTFAGVLARALGRDGAAKPPAARDEKGQCVSGAARGRPPGPPARPRGGARARVAVALRLHERDRVREDLDCAFRSCRARSAPRACTSSTVVLALASALTILAMAPVGQRIADRAAPLFAAGKTPDTVTLIEGGIDAFREADARLPRGEREPPRERARSSPSLRRHARP